MSINFSKNIHNFIHKKLIEHRFKSPSKTPPNPLRGLIGSVSIVHLPLRGTGGGNYLRLISSRYARRASSRTALVKFRDTSAFWAAIMTVWISTDSGS
jgi:hypothetical protein